MAAARYSGKYSFRIQNTYVVPIQRQRLAFAVLVRRALEELEPWAPDDLIAVTIPRSVASPLELIVREHRTTTPFPVKQIVSRWPGDAYREVFPVTPTDGMVEAVRYAIERDLSWEGIDREIAPGNLIDRLCLADPLLAEDELALAAGIDGYLRLVRDEQAVAPARFDPIDALREVFIAESLQVLAPVHRRVLVVCDAVNFEGIKRHIASPSRALSREVASQRAAPMTRIAQPRLDVALRYLDDFPRLTARFEEMRKAGTGASFDKWSALMHVLQRDVIRGDKGYRSIRRLDTFLSYLRGILGAQRRRTPGVHDVQEAFKGCFGSARASRMLHELARYGDYVDVERIDAAVPHQSEIYALRDRRPAAHHVARSCNSTPGSFVLRVRPVRSPSRGLPNSQVVDSVDWKRARMKAIALLQQSSIEQRTEPFRGSLERGIDARRTLRGLLAPTPVTWVRRSRRHGRDADLAQQPVVWIFQLAHRLGHWSGVGHLKCACAIIQKKQYCATSRFLGNENNVFRSSDGDLTVTSSEALGRVNYWDGEFERVPQILGAKWKKRLPLHRKMDPYTPVGCVLESLEAQVAAGVPWWDILIMSAIEYARSEVLCVVPDGFRPSPLVLAAATSQGKTLHFSRIHQFSRRERERMGMVYSVGFPRDAEKDPAFMKRIETCLKDLGIW